MSDISLPFNPVMQQAIIGHALSDAAFSEKVSTRVEHTWFNDATLAKLYDATVAFRGAFGRMPTPEELQTTRHFQNEEPSVREAMRASLGACLAARQTYGVDVLQSQLGEWRRVVLYKAGAETATALYQQMKFDEAFGTMRDTLSTLDAAHFGDDSLAPTRFTVEDLMVDPPDVDFLLQDRILSEAGAVGTLSGPGGVGKSSLLTGFILCRALGVNFLDIPTKPGKTLVITAEESVKSYRRKLAAWRIGTGNFDPQKVIDNVAVISLQGRSDSKLVQEEGGRYVENRGLVTDLARQAKKFGADFIVLETISRLGADETNEGHSSLVSAVERMANEAGASAILVGHTGKGPAATGNIGSYAGRGGSSLSDNARFNLVLQKFPEDAKAAEKLLGMSVSEKMAEALTVFHAPKVNEAPPTPPMVLVKVPTKYGLVYKLADKDTLEADAEKHRAHQLQVNVHKLFSMLKDLPDGTTVTALKAMKKDDRGFTKAEVDDTLALAITWKAVKVVAKRITAVADWHAETPTHLN